MISLRPGIQETNDGIKSSFEFVACLFEWVLEIEHNIELDETFTFNGGKIMNTHVLEFLLEFFKYCDKEVKMQVFF